ncbi:hypothetical protein JCGZ_04213 [Jatropha curcas]|uniref:Uncharacterized protein n=1 Tax=Jatropha curcas TaxID=180498 RepID=A0A067J9Z1_JATCU|nr:hypothetical protein JCGZ_04213 [Jatropha curcas]
MAILSSWPRGAYLVEAGVFRGRTATYEAWWMAKHGDRERENRATLKREMDARLWAMTKTTLDSTRQPDPEGFDDSREMPPRRRRRLTRPVFL